jgi:hypothetical protein
MGTSQSPRSRAQRVVTSSMTLAGGVSLAAVPAATLAISARVFDEVEQGAVSLAIMASTFIGQIAFAAIVESRLSSPSSNRRVELPRWLVGAALVAGSAVALTVSNALVVCIALPILLAALEVGRGVSVTERLDARETAAALLVAVGGLAGVCVALIGMTWGFVPLVGGIVLATIVRALPVEHRASPIHRRTATWVISDVAITGVIYPALNAVILVTLGPVQAVLFAAISTVSGLLSIPLNFMRLRLLKAHSTLDIWVAAAALAGATIVIGILEFSGILGIIFGSAWSLDSTLVPLGVACAWRAASLATTLPFAALRRSGRVKLLTVLRGTIAVITFAGGVAVVNLQDISLVFAIMLLGELLQAITYHIALRHMRSRALDDVVET